MFEKKWKEIKSKQEELEKLESSLNDARKYLDSRITRINYLVNFLEDEASKKLEEEYLLSSPSSIYTKKYPAADEVFMVYKNELYSRLAWNNDDARVINKDTPWRKAEKIPQEVFEFFYNNKKCD